MQKANSTTDIYIMQAFSPFLEELGREFQVITRKLNTADANMQLIREKYVNIG